MDHNNSENRAPDRAALAQQTLAGYAHGPDAPLQAEAQALARLDEARAALLVEGISDQIALETLAARQGRDLAEEKILVVPIGGAQSILR